MSSRPYVVDATPENFPELVLENSRKGPVFVHYWAPWAGPCLKLWPALERLAQDYQGRFLLVNVNTDKHKALARDYNVNSVPTLKVFRERKVVDQVHGAESESSLRQLVERHLPQVRCPEHEAALQALERGEHERALTSLSEAVRLRPQDARIALDRAKLLLQLARLDEAEAALVGLPAELQEEGAVCVLRARIGLLRASADAPTPEALAARLEQAPDDCAARHQLAALLLFADDYAGALAQLLELVRRDRHYGDDAGRRGMLAVFHILGPEHPLVQQYRGLLENALF